MSLFPARLHLTLPAALVAAVCAGGAMSGDAIGTDPLEALAGGDTSSIEAASQDAFSHPAANLALADNATFITGRALFRKLWVPAPSSTTGSDGLGPLYNARSCLSCHVRDGGGTLDGDGLVIRLGQGIDFAPDPALGAQFQDKAATGLASEGNIALRWTETVRHLPDGTTVTLRKPDVMLQGPSETPEKMPGLSPRLAPPVIGAGLIAAIPDERLAALADPDDRNDDGVSGRIRTARDLTGRERIGRFGWKAQAADVAMQTASALSADMGLSTRLFPRPGGDCTGIQASCLSRPHGGDEDGIEIPDQAFKALVFYTEHVAVPARRGAHDREVLTGKALFHATGCATCHVPSHETARTGHAPALIGQTIYPYSDFLLHDLGEGLADPSDAADRAEWRTPPLWGLGLRAIVSPGSSLLHDGRAHNVLEAVLWHDGEARTSRQAFEALRAEDRARLIRFVESL